MGELDLFEELHWTDDEETPVKGMDDRAPAPRRVDGEGSQAGVDDV